MMGSLELGVRPQLAHERVATHHRHHDVAQDQVRPELERLLQPLTAVESGRHR